MSIMLDPLLFMAVLEALTCEAKKGLPSELLYVDDMMSVAESLKELKENVLTWKDRMETKGPKINISETKLMVSGVNCGDVKTTGK